MLSLGLLYFAFAQLDKPPEFSTGPGFRKSDVDAAIDSAAHTSGQKTESARWMVRSLTEWTRRYSQDEHKAWLTAMQTLSSGALADAGKKFAQGARQFPASPRLAVGQAAAIYAQGAYEKSAEVLLRAADRHPHELRLIRYLSEVEEAHAGVMPRLKRWADANPKSADAQYAYGSALARTAPAMAERYLALAIRLAPADARPHVAIAKFSEGQKAMDHWEQAAQLDPDNAQTHYRLALAYGQAGEQAKSAEHMERYKALKR